MTKPLFVLTEKNKGKVWGVFEDTNHLMSIYRCVKELKVDAKLVVTQFLLNTTIVVHEADSEDAVTELCGYQSRSCKQDLPREILPEIQRVKEKLSIFKDNMNTFKRLLDDGVITLESDFDQVPELFRDKFDIYRDIIRLDVPETEAFSYFNDRYRS
jgi:hypothetical protein